MDGKISLKKRDIFLQFLLFFLTGGLYFLYWLYMSNKELVKIEEDTKPDIFSNLALTGFVLYFIIFFYEKFFLLKQKIDLSLIYVPLYLGVLTLVGGLYSLSYIYVTNLVPVYALFVPIVVEAWLIFYVIKYFRAYKDELGVDFSFGVLLVLFIFARPFGVMYFQHSINKSLRSKSSIEEAHTNDQLKDEIKDEDREKNSGMKKDLLQSQNIQSQGSLSYNEEHAKKYIEEFKNSYSKDSIKIELRETGMLDDEIEKYLDRYY